MTVILELTPEEQLRVEQQAAKLGIAPADFLHHLIQRDTETDGDSKPFGARLLQHWETEGTLGLFEDRPDSPEFARELRLKAQQRG